MTWGPVVEGVWRCTMLRVCHHRGRGREMTRVYGSGVIPAQEWGGVS